MSLYNRRFQGQREGVDRGDGCAHVDDRMLDGIRSEFFNRATLQHPYLLRELHERREEVARMMRDIVEDRYPGLLPGQVTEVLGVLMRDLYGWGPISELMSNPAVTDIWINNWREIFYEENGEVKEWPHTFISEEHLRRTAERMAMSVGRKIDEARPIEDCRLHDGSRVAIVIPPVATRGTCVTIRRFPKLFTLEELAAEELFPAEYIELFTLMVKARLNIFAAGGMGSGKNTLLSALLLKVSPRENLILIEDPAESRVGLPDPRRPDLPQPKVKVFEPRRPNIEGQGAVPLSIIFEKALRMKPTRVIVSECREEIATYYTLQAMNLGHPGSMSTVHVEDVTEVPTRLSDLLAPYPGGAYAQLAARAGKVKAAEVIFFLAQIEGPNGTGQKFWRLLDVAEIRPRGDQVPEVVRLLTFKLREFGADGRPVGRLEPTGETPEFLRKGKLRLFLAPEEIRRLASFFPGAQPEEVPA